MMKKKRIVAALMASVILTATALSGCGSNKGGSAPASKADSSSSAKADPESSGTTTGEKLAADQVITINQLEAITLDSAQIQDTQSATLIVNTMEGLFRNNTNEDGSSVLEKAGCTDYTISDDGLVYTFKLRPNKWSDGEPVTAKDYVFAVKRLLDPQLGCGYAFFATGLVNGDAYLNGTVTDFTQVGVKATDDMTVEYTLASPDSSFLDKLGNMVFFPLREDIVTPLGDTYGQNIDGMVFNGPFKITSWSSKDSGVWEKNTEYWDADNVKLTEINLNYVPEPATRDKLFLQGDMAQVGGAGEFLGKYKEMAQKGDIREMHRPTAGNLFWFTYKFSGGPSGLMSNEKIRKAVGYAIDNKAYCETIYNRYTPANSFIPSSIMLGDSTFRSQSGAEPWKADSDKYRNNPEELQKLFKEGLTELGKQTDDLSKYTLAYLTYGESSLARQSQEFIQQALQKNLGVNVDMKILSGWQQYGAEIKGDEWDISMNGWSPDYNEPMTFFDIWLTGGTSNYQGYSSPEYDALIAKAVATTDPAKRLDIYKQCEQMLADATVFTPIYFPDVYAYFIPKFRGYQVGTIGFDFDYKSAYLVE